jgi:hypothetical protein
MRIRRFIRRCFFVLSEFTFRWITFCWGTLTRQKLARITWYFLLILKNLSTTPNSKYFPQTLFTIKQTPRPTSHIAWIWCAFTLCLFLSRQQHWSMASGFFCFSCLVSHPQHHLLTSTSAWSTSAKAAYSSFSSIGGATNKDVEVQEHTTTPSDSFCPNSPPLYP